MALNLTQVRTINADITVQKGDETIIVKSLTATIDENGVTQLNTYFTNEEVYAEFRPQVRKDEKKLQEYLYQVEDEVIAAKTTEGEK